MNDKNCPRCHQRLKDWNELKSDEKFTVERLPASADFTFKERKKHRFCVRCWFEDVQPIITKA